MAVEPGDSDSHLVAPQLNDDCLIRILKFIPVRERIRLECICKRWKDDLLPALPHYVKSLEFAGLMSPSGKDSWEKVIIPRSVLNNPHLYTRDCGTHLVLARRIIASVFDRFGAQLESICFTELPWAVDVEELNILKEKCPHLKLLDLSHVRVSAQALASLGKQLRGLESLLLKHSEVKSPLEQFNSLMLEQELGKRPPDEYSSFVAEMYLENTLKLWPT